MVKLIPREIREQEFPEAMFLSKGEQAIYEKACEQFSEKARKSLRVPLKGSNLFKVLLLNQIGIRTATLPELECAMENGFDLKGIYGDVPSVILRSAEDFYEKNNYLSKSLAEKLKLNENDFKVPKIINGLGIIDDEKSFYGIGFDTKNAQIIEAPYFSYKNNLRKFSRINSDYSIEFDEKSNRTLYTRSNGLSGVYLNWNGDLGSSDDYLANSTDYGRVVVVDAEGVAKIFLKDN